jgi:broad specificity phosphatase PhoE
MKLVLVRHGAVENPRGLRYGCLPGFRLSALGEAQAHAAGRELARRGLVGNAVVIASPLERAQQTAARLAEHLAPLCASSDPRLRERGSVRDGLHRAPGLVELARRLAEPGALARHERRVEVERRMLAAIAEGLSSAHAVGAVALVAVSHQAPIGIARAGLVRRRRGATADAIVRAMPWPLRAPPCGLGSITELIADGASWRVHGVWSPPCERGS